MSDLTRHNKSEWIDEEGQFNCRIKSARNDYNRQGEEVIVVIFQDKESGKCIRKNYQDNDKYGFLLQRLAQTCGLTETQQKNFDDPAVLVGREVVVVTEMNGQYTNVKDVFPPIANDIVKPPRHSATSDDVPF